MKDRALPWHTQFKRTPKVDRTFDGILFDSALEMRVWKDLKLMEAAGEVTNVVRQVIHKLILPNGTPILTPSGRIASYRPDMEYDRKSDGAHIVIEVKGFVDTLSAFRISVFEAISGHKVVIVKK